MTNERVVLTREVADAIEHLRSRGDSNFDIVRCSSLPSLNENAELILGSYVKTVKEQELLLKALINGYDIKKTPEGSVLEYYMEIKRLAEKAQIEDEYYAESEFQSEMLGIVTTLNKLGIVIDQINGN